MDENFGNFLNNRGVVVNVVEDGVHLVLVYPVVLGHISHLNRIFKLVSVFQRLNPGLDQESVRIGGREQGKHKQPILRAVLVHFLEGAVYVVIVTESL